MHPIPPVDDDRDDRDDDDPMPPVPASERARYYDLVREMETVIAELIDAYHTAQELSTYARQATKAMQTSWVPGPHP